MAECRCQSRAEELELRVKTARGGLAGNHRRVRPTQDVTDIVTLCIPRRTFKAPSPRDIEEGRRLSIGDCGFRRKLDACRMSAATIVASSAQR